MTTALLADIGGTNARFALLRDGTPGAVLRLSIRDFPDLGHALDQALPALGAGTLDGVAVCAAGPPLGGRIVLTNCPWEISTGALRAATGVPRPVLVNDFAALAAALPELAARDLEAVGEGCAQPGAPRAVLGPGTGLGIAGFLGAGAIVTGEGGHADLAAASAGEDRILAHLRARFGHVSAERVLSGPGLSLLHGALHPGSAPCPPEAISAAAARGEPRALASIRQFCAFLGAVAGNLALTLGAHGGVYLGGGIVPGWGALFARDVFRERFEDKGRYRQYLASIPTYIITTPDPALRGLASLLANPPAGA